jgi:peroxiredoxin
MDTPTNAALPRWPSTVLKLAAVYNLAWGAWVILFPNHLFDWTGIARPNYPGIWQCVGMIVGVYGVGYWAAARDFTRHWPIVLVGFMGKILGPIGFFQSALTGQLPWNWGLTIISNDLIWWVPFGAMLYLAFKANTAPLRDFNDSLADGVDQANATTMTSSGQSLAEYSAKGKTLLIFVRHAGCTFCRETLTQLQHMLPSLQSQSIRPVVVHMSSELDGQRMLDAFGLSSVVHISNPDCSLYRAYELKRGEVSQLFGPQVWWKGFRAAILKGHGVGKLSGDGFQLGGAFLIENGRITKSFPAKNAADTVPFECVLTP